MSTLQPVRPTLQKRPPPRLELMRRHLHVAAHGVHALAPQQAQHHVRLCLRTPPLRQIRLRLLLAHHRHDPHSWDPSELVQMPVQGNRGLYRTGQTEGSNPSSANSREPTKQQLYQRLAGTPSRRTLPSVPAGMLRITEWNSSSAVCTD